MGGGACENESHGHAGDARRRAASLFRGNRRRHALHRAAAAYLEGELDFLRGLPKIKVHPDDPQRQQATPAAKLYKELLQQYTNCIKVLAAVLRRDAPEEESPLRAYLEERRKQNGGA